VSSIFDSQHKILHLSTEHLKIISQRIQEGTQCTKCKNDWALKTSIALLYVLCTLLTIAVAVLGYK
ncbi:Collectin-12, partial [Dissostichus eleginoides]